MELTTPHGQWGCAVQGKAFTLCRQYEGTSVRHFVRMAKTLTGIFMISLLGFSFSCSDELPFGSHVELHLMFSYGSVYDGDEHSWGYLSINADGLGGPSDCIPLNSDDIDMWWDESDDFQYETIEAPPAGTSDCWDDNELQYENITAKGGTFHFEFAHSKGTLSLAADLPPDYSASIIPGTLDEVIVAQQFRIEWTAAQVKAPHIVKLWKVSDGASGFDFPECELVESETGYAVYALPSDLPADYFSENVPIQVDFVDIIRVERCQGVESCSVSVLKHFRFFDD